MSATKYNGGPAFPPTFPGRTDGMTLRDYFAAKAMQGMCASTEYMLEARDTATARGSQVASVVAVSAYEVADAMLEARKA